VQTSIFNVFALLVLLLLRMSWVVFNFVIYYIEFFFFNQVINSLYKLSNILQTMANLFFPSYDEFGAWNGSPTVGDLFSPLDDTGSCYTIIKFLYHIIPSFILFWVFSLSSSLWESLFMQQPQTLEHN
jgi:hypothetical protein